MQNELCRVGQLIYDLRQNTYFTPGQENFDFLDQEFARISLALGVEWDKVYQALNNHFMELLRRIDLMIVGNTSYNSN